MIMHLWRVFNVGTPEIPDDIAITIIVNRRRVSTPIGAISL